MYYPRKIEQKITENLNHKRAIIVTGMRRTGKTTLLKRFYEVLENCLWFDFENPFDVKFFEEIDYKDIYLNFKQKGLKEEEKMNIFIDEVQNYPEITKIVKYLSDHYNIQFFLTGSTNYYLKNLFPESLAGRKVLLEMFPLDFEEFLGFRKQNPTIYRKAKKQTKNSIINYEQFDHLYDEFVEWGGFPQVVLEKDPVKKVDVLKDIFASYYQKEIVKLAHFRKSRKVRDLIIILSRRIGSKLDIVKISQELELTRKTVYNYLDFLQSSYFIFLIQPFSKSADREISASSKLFFCDNGFLKLFPGISQGQIFENSIFNQLKQQGSLNYYQTKRGKEIDFILNRKIGFEVKNKASKVDVARLKKIAKKLKLEKCFIISKEFSNLEENLVYGEFV